MVSRMALKCYALIAMPRHIRKNFHLRLKHKQTGSKTITTGITICGILEHDIIFIIHTITVLLCKMIIECLTINRILIFRTIMHREVFLTVDSRSLKLEATWHRMSEFKHKTGKRYKKSSHYLLEDAIWKNFHYFVDN
jgi:hypothetical protein